VPAPAESASEPAGGPPSVSTPSLSPLVAESWLIPLPVEGFRPAQVSVPLGARERRPIVVALHGAGDRPEWACGGWRGVTDAYPFIVCPTGQPAADGFAWGPVAMVEREVTRSVEAVRARFGDHVAEGCALLVGFSQGAIRGVPMLAAGRGWCPIAALCEGAYEALGERFGRAFLAWGGRRILLGCSQPHCAKAFRQREEELRQTGIEVRTVFSGERVHNLNGEMVRTLNEAWPWLVQDDERWSSYVSASRQKSR
jgi:hypothetical protein